MLLPTTRLVVILLGDHRWGTAVGPFYAKGQTGQQLLLGAYSSLSRMVEAGKVKLFTRYEMEDIVI